LVIAIMFTCVHYYTLKNDVALLKPPHLNVAIFNLLKCGHIKYTDVAIQVRPHWCGYRHINVCHKATPVWLYYVCCKWSLSKQEAKLSLG